MKFNKSKAYKSAALGVAGTLTALAVPFATTTTASASSMNWDRVAACESGGNWSTSTGNGFYGGLQFTPSTWRAYGGQGSANHASRAQQIAVAERVLAAQGPGAWPVCSRGAGHASRSTVRHALPKRTVSHHRVVKHSRHRVVRHHALRHHKHHYRVVKHHRHGGHHHRVVRHHR